MKRGFLAILIVICFTSLSFASDYLYKHKEGTVKTFKIITKGPLVDNSGSNSAKALAPMMLAGKKVYPWVWKNGLVLYMHYDKIGVYTLAGQKPSDVEPQIVKNINYEIKYPIKVGTSWQKELTTYLLEKKIDVSCTRKIESLKDTVTVPAGTFKNCLRMKTWGKRVIKGNNPYISKYLMPTKGFWVSVEIHSWYAPKVGWIKSIIKHNTNHSHVGYPTERVMLLTGIK